jgi:hypothetical protein
MRQTSQPIQKDAHPTMLVAFLFFISALPSLATAQTCELQGKQLIYQFQGMKWTYQLTVLGKKILKHFEDRTIGHEYVIGASVDALTDVSQKPAFDFTSKRELGQGGGVQYRKYIVRADFDGRQLKLTDDVSYESLFPGGGLSAQTINIVEETVIHLNDCLSCQVTRTVRGEALYYGRKVRPVSSASSGVSCRIDPLRR